MGTGGQGAAGPRRRLWNALIPVSAKRVENDPRTGQIANRCLSVSISIALKNAVVAELVDAPDLGSGAERRGGSIPFNRTIFSLTLRRRAEAQSNRSLLRRWIQGGLAIR
jgi:hypothetical protein